jgi:hypothetical protein
VDDQFKYIIEDCDTAEEAYKALKAEFVKPTMHARVQARQALYSIIYDPSCPISAFISAVEDAVKALKDLGVITISEDEQKDVLLFCLHESFSVVCTTIYSQSTEPSLAIVKTILKGADNNAISSDDLWIKPEPVNIALRAQTNRGCTSSHPIDSGSLSSPTSSCGSRRDDKGYNWCDTTCKGVCHHCGQHGHITAYCMYPMPQQVKDWIIASTSPPRKEAYA